MNECSQPQEQQNQKYRKQLRGFSLEFKQGDLREFYHLLFEQCSYKLFNTAMVFKLIILTTFTIAEFVYFEDNIVSSICLICLLLFFILWYLGYKIRHQMPTAFRISHVLLSMIMYILVMQIQNRSEDDIVKSVQQNSSQSIENYDFENNKLGAFFSMLFSLYQIVYIQIEIKWFFRAFHFLFILLLNWFILVVNEITLLYGVFYFIFITILLYQLEVTKKEDSFQMYRVIEDFQSIKTLINDILPMQIFIVQRNTQINKSTQNQRFRQINTNNQDTQLNQNTISNQILTNAQFNLEEANSKQEQTRVRQVSAADKDSICINGISTAYGSNKKTVDQIRQYPDENTQQRRKESAQSTTNRNNQNIQSGFNKQKQNRLNLSGSAINSVVKNSLDLPVTPNQQSIQSNYGVLHNKNNPQKSQLINIVESKPKNIKQSTTIQLCTQDNEENNFTEHLATNPPLINKNEVIPAPSTRICNLSGANNNIQRTQQLTNQNSQNPLKITFANKLIHQDFQSSTLDDILKELKNIFLPLNPKNNEINQTLQNKKSGVNSKLITETLYDALLAKLYRKQPLVLTSQLINQNNIQNNMNNIGQSASIAGQQTFPNQQQNMQASVIGRSNNQNNQQINTSNGIPVNFTEEIEVQTKFLNLPSHRSQQNYQKSPFSQSNQNNGVTINGGFQEVLQKKLSPFIGNIAGIFGGASEMEYNAGIAVSEKGGQMGSQNIQQNHTSNNNNLWNSVHRLGNQTGIAQGNDSLNGNIPNDSGIFNSHQNYQEVGQQLIQQQQYYQQILSNQNHLNNDNLNMYNYIPSSRINKVWEYLNCFFKKSSNQNNNQNGVLANNGNNSNNTRRANNLEIIGNQQSQQQQQEEEKNYDIKLVECKWEGEESIMVIMNNINERLMRERLLQIEQYKDTMIDTISHNLKTPLNCILAPLESIKLMLEEQKQEEQNIMESKYKRSVDKSNSRLLINKSIIRSQIEDDGNAQSLINYGTTAVATTTGEIVKQVSMAINNCQLLLYMINDMIDYSEIIKGENCFRLDLDYFKINYVTKTLNNLFQDQMQSKKIEFKITQRIDLSEQIFFHDQRRLLQILVNLISNSLKFTLKGKVELIIDNPSDDSAQNTGSHHHYQFNQVHASRYIMSPSSNRNKQQFLNSNELKSVQSNLNRQQSRNQESIQSNNQLTTEKVPEKKKTHSKEKHIRFTVIDSGIGMQPFKLQKLKRMLFKKERSQIQNSSGLGLTMCYSLIKQIGCQHTHLEILSEEKHGSSFSFIIQQFYKNSSHSPVAPTNANLQSASHLQKQSSFAQLVNGLTINTNIPQQQQTFGNFEIKEESIQTKVSPLLKKEITKDEFNLNMPTFSGIQMSKVNSNQIIKQQSSLNSVLNINANNNIISNLSNLITKTTLENQNAIPKTINTLCNDEHILDTSTEEREDNYEKNKVKTNNRTQPTKLNYNKNDLAMINQIPLEQQNSILKDYKTIYSTVSHNFNNSPTGNSLMINQELNNAIALHNNVVQKANSLQVNMNQSSISKNTKSQKLGIGPQSLNQFSMVSLTPNMQEKQKNKGRKKNLKELNSMYSSITQRHTMIFGKSLKSDAFDNDNQDEDNQEEDQNLEKSSCSEEEENNDEYYNTDNSFKNQFSYDKKGKAFIFKSEHQSHNVVEEDFQDILNEQNLAQITIKKPAIELEFPSTNQDEGDSKKSKPVYERRAFPTFGEADFNLKKFIINQGISSNSSVQNKEKELNQNNKAINELQNSPLSSHDPNNSDHVSENKDQILTQKYHFSAPSRNLDSNLFSPNLVFDNVIESRHHSIKLEQIALLQDNNENQVLEQDIFSNLFIFFTLYDESFSLPYLFLIRKDLFWQYSFLIASY